MLLALAAAIAPGMVDAGQPAGKVGKKWQPVVPVQMQGGTRHVPMIGSYKVHRNSAARKTTLRCRSRKVKNKRNSARRKG